MAMARPKNPDPENTPRIHFIKEWALHRGYEPDDLCEGVYVDKSSVSRWYNGTIPSAKHLLALAGFFGIDVADLFRAPGDDWLRRFFENRAEEELERIKMSLELHFPRKVA